MKVILYCILFMLFAHDNGVNARNVTYIEIKKVDFDLMTFFSIECDKFEKYFSNVHTVIIKDIKKIQNITRLLDRIKKYPSDYIPDVRAKILIYYDNDTIDTVCVSYSGILINGTSFKLDNELVQVIEKITVEEFINAYFKLFKINGVHQEANRNKRLKDLLIGEWEFCREEPKYAEDEEIPLDFYQPIGIEFFQDSIEFFNGFFQTYKDSLTDKLMTKYYGNFVSYHIKQDSIFIQNAFDYNVEFKWKFICLSNDTLNLSTDDTTILKFKRLTYNIDPIPDFDQIVYSSSGCYGWCPIIDISIDNNGHIFFQGEGYVEKLGFYEGQADSKLKKSVFNKFKKSNPLKLQEHYSAGHSDDECITTTYIKNNKILKTIHDYGRAVPSELIWAYIPIANLHNIINLNNIPDDEPFYPKYHYYTFEKGRFILPLEKSESFYLWTELKKSETTSQEFIPDYTVTFNRNYTYWGHDVSQREHKYEYKQIISDGRFFTFEYKNAPSVTYDLGYNFIERNFEENDFIEMKKGSN